MLHISCGPSLFIVYPVGLFCASFFHCAPWCQWSVFQVLKHRGGGLLRCCCIDWHTDFFLSVSSLFIRDDFALLPGFYCRPIRCQSGVQGWSRNKNRVFIYLRLSNYKYADIALLFRRFTLTSVSFVSPVIPVNPKQQYCWCSQSTQVGA